MTHGLSDQINPIAAHTPQAVTILNLQERIRFLEADKRMADTIIAAQAAEIAALRATSTSTYSWDAQAKAAYEAEIETLRGELEDAEAVMRESADAMRGGKYRVLLINEANIVRAILKASAK